MGIELDLVEDLRRIAGGAAARAPNDFTFERDGVEVRVVYVSGSSSSLRFVTPYDKNARINAHAGFSPDERGGYREGARRELRGVRPMAIALLRENHVHVAAKASGTNAEVQTGDPAFDDAVYVDTPSDPDLVRAVLGHGARAATRALLDLGIRRVDLDAAGAIEARIDDFLSVARAGDRAERLVAAFVDLARSVPVVARAEGAHPVAPYGALRVAGATTAFLGMVLCPMVYFAIASAVECTEPADEGVSLKDGCGTPAIVGIAFAIVGASIAVRLTARYLAPALRGRSDSLDRIGSTYGAAGAIGAVAGFLVGAALAFATGLGRPT